MTPSNQARAEVDDWLNEPGALPIGVKDSIPNGYIDRLIARLTPVFERLDAVTKERDELQSYQDEYDHDEEQQRCFARSIRDSSNAMMREALGAESRQRTKS